jgi:hypothetical protein
MREHCVPTEKEHHPQREGAAAVAVPQSPDAGHVGLELIVDDDVAALVGRGAGPFETQVVLGTRPTARSRCVHATSFGSSLHCIRTATPPSRFASEDTFRIQPDVYASASRISRTAWETSSSSRPIRRGRISTMSCSRLTVVAKGWYKKPQAQTRNWREQLLHVRGSSQEIGLSNLELRFHFNDVKSVECLLVRGTDSKAH